ncbi:MAG TPA: hypothetical protein PLI97_06855 [Fluviicola sp.]|nr:hypothetical protein [Fluviicola sp.]
MSKSKLSKQEQLNLTQLLSEIQGNDQQKIAKALKALSIHGHVSILEDLAKVWTKGLSTENELAMSQLFHDIKDSSAVPVLMEIFKNTAYQSIHRKLLISFWNSKLDFTSHLADFILFAIEGAFEDTLEALTLIENFENLPPESAILESQLLLKEYFGQEQGREAQKDVLLSEIAVIIKNFSDEEGLDDLYFE